MAIIGERSVKHDRFKGFISRCAGGSIHVRLLLLDPEAGVFAERASEERERVEGWRQDLEATIQRLKHYRELYNAKISVRLYDVYPVWRIMIADETQVIVNVFLPGKRGSESDQLLFPDRDGELAKAYVNY